MKNIWQQAYNQYFPCRQPIHYSIGTFDTRFGVSKDYFISAIKSAEDIWEKSIGRNLFVYSPEGNLKINLIYDKRQEATSKLNNLSSTLDNSKASYDKLVLEYKSLVAEYNRKNALFEARLKDYNLRKEAYESEVEQANRRGGANKETYARLNAEKEYLNREVAVISKLQDELKGEVEVLNSYVANINRLASSLNIDVKKYNSIGESLPDEFDEGVYRSSVDGQEIDIYQFDSEIKLIRVLAHEFGHALDLGHLDDSKAIMYRLNNGINEKLTESDLLALKAKCGIK